MSKAKLRSNGLGIVSEGLELSEDQLPPFGNDKIKVYPMEWKNPLTGKLAMMVYQTLSERFILKMAAFSIILPKFATGCINYNDVRFIPIWSIYTRYSGSAQSDGEFALVLPSFMPTI
ncbi:hypothetical protein PENSUB_11956 [Penicillium subrubescens]|uniref:Uncharacterized protein n=1 Tax=Penicillium subrubescens TaxID=1316194 RepID=A0A1Q5T079_9EURO|nr:hypothetical protein PENSUB_11956 [Penicillium subrubescens]